MVRWLRPFQLWRCGRMTCFYTGRLFGDGRQHANMARKIPLSDTVVTSIAMSALGQKRTHAVRQCMSALPLKADISPRNWNNDWHFITPQYANLDVRRRS